MTASDQSASYAVWYGTHATWHAKPRSSGLQCVVFGQRVHSLGCCQGDNGASRAAWYGMFATCHHLGCCQVDYGASYVDWYGEEARRVNGAILPAHVTGRRVIILKQVMCS